MRDPIILDAVKAAFTAERESRRRKMNLYSTCAIGTREANAVADDSEHSELQTVLT